jgi:hypothetical protein
MTLPTALSLRSLRQFEHTSCGVRPICKKCQYKGLTRSFVFPLLTSPYLSIKKTHMCVIHWPSSTVVCFVFSKRTRRHTYASQLIGAHWPSLQHFQFCRVGLSLGILYFSILKRANFLLTP